SHQTRNEVSIEIVEQVPGQNGVKGVAGVLQAPAKETFGARRGRHVRWLFARPKHAQLLFLEMEESPPGVQQIFGVNLESALDEETHSGLPDRTEVEQAAVLDPVEVPEKVLEAIGRARVGGSMRGLRSPSSRSHPAATDAPRNHMVM